MIKYKSVPINKIGDVVTGRTPKTSDQTNYGTEYMFVGPTDLHKHFVIRETEKTISRKGLDSVRSSNLDGVSVLVGCIGWDMGNVALVEDKCVTNQQINSITNVKPAYNPYYIYYWLKGKKDFLFQQASVTRTPILNKSTFSSIEIPLPARDYQDKVAKILSVLDSKISLNNRINAELESMAKTIYDYWFVQFDFPISAALAAQMGKSELEGKPYKSSGGEMMWDEKIKREVPKGWEVKTLGSYSKVKSGFAFKSSWWQGSGVTVLKIKNIQEDNSISFADCSFVAPDKAEKAKNFIGNPGSVIIAMTGATIGKFGIIPDTGQSVLINQRVGLFDMGEKPMLRLPFLINSLRQQYVRENIFKIASGAAQPNISAEEINSLQLILPPQGVVQDFNFLLASSYQKLLNNVKENQELASLRDWLLPMLMNGQVKVGEMKEYVQEEELRMVAEESETYGKVVPLKREKLNGIEKTALGGHIINMHYSKGFGRTQLMKLLHLTEYNCQLPMDTNYWQYAAGPYNEELIHDIEDRLKRFRFFDIRQDYTGNHKVSYRPLAAAKEIESQFTEHFGNDSEQIDDFLSKFKGKFLGGCEVISTLYAVWNNRIISQQPITDDLLKEDFLAWDPQKVKYTGQLDESLQWMRENDVVPEGWGKVIGRRET